MEHRSVCRAAAAEVMPLHEAGKPAPLAGSDDVNQLVLRKNIDLHLIAGIGAFFTLNADFSHEPASLPALLAASREADVVLGSRYVEGGGTVNWGLGRRLLSKGGSLYARIILGLQVRDLTGGFKCFRREVLERLDLPSVHSTGYAFQIELTYRAVKRGFRIVEVPITFADRRVGKSKMNRRIVAEALWKVWKIRFDRAANSPR